MKKLLLLLFLVFFGNITANAQITDQTVNVSPTSGACTVNAVVNLAGSQTGINYYLRDDADNTVIEGPIAGTGSAINFTVESINVTKTYNVLATSDGNALNFDGINDHLIANNTIVPQGNSSFTIEAWVKPTSINSDNVIQWGSDSANQKNAIELLPTGVIRHYFWANDLDSPATNLGDGNWHHIACTYNGTTRTIYLDGVPIADDTPPTPNVTGTTLIIGQHFANRNFHGQMDEVRIWNTARTLTEIQNNKDTSSPTGSGLVAQYKFDENSGTTASDNSVNNQPASLINMDAANAWVPGFDFAELEMSITPTVTVTASTTPAPTGLATQVYTGDDKTLANLSVTGTSITWYDAATAGTMLPSTTALLDDTTYYASNTDGCESIARLAVTVNRISDNAQTLTCTPTVTDLTATPSAGLPAQWFATISSTTPLASTAALATGTYYVAQGVTGTIETLDLGFNFSTGVAVQADGKILVTDSGNDAIKRMDVDGTNIITLGSGFSFPTGVAVQADGKILIADRNNNAIKRMDADGTNIESLGAGFVVPYGVAVQADGKILVADFGNNAIKRMDADGTNIETLGSGFNQPSGVTVQADGKILIADRVNNAIKRMDADGTNVVTLGSGFNQPYGVAVQADGKILVVDTNNNAIKRMDGDGNNVVTLSSGFNQPVGVAVEADGKILVTDTRNNAIKRITEASISNRVAVSVTVPTTSPEIDVLGNGISIADGDTTPRTLDFTYFGDVKMSSRTVERLFGIDNTAGTSDLNIASIVSTSDSDFGGMATNGYPRLVRAGTIGYFTVRFNLRTLGFKTATIIINSDDCDEGSYEFTLKGNVLPDLTITGSCSDTEVLGNYFEESFLLNGKPAYRKGGVPTDTSPSCNDFTNPTTCAEVDSTLSRYVMAWDGSQWEWYKESTSLDCVWFPLASMCIPNFNSGSGSGSTKVVLATNSSNTAVPPCTGWVAATAGCLPTLSNCETPNPEINISGNNTVLNFDGVDDYVDLGTNVLATATEFTIEAWYYPTTNNRNWTRILEFSNSTTQYFFLGSSQANSGQPYFFINDGSSPIADISAPNALPLNTWSHIAVTLSGTTATMYIDGTQVAQNTSFNLNPADIGATTNSWLGKSVFTGDPYYLPGNLDDVRIWNVARTVAEINANNYSKLNGNEAGLLAYYQFEDAPGNADNSATGNNILTAEDETGSNNATLNNFNRIGDASNWIYKEANFWDGSESTNWNDNNNWSTAAVPLATESVVIPNVTNQPVIDASTSIEIANITMTNNTSLTVDGVLKVGNQLSNDGEITFKSNTSSTGQFDEFTGSISGTGDITVERFIPAGKRAFRFISPSVTTTSSIYDNWQEGGATAAGLGTHISGLDGTVNGFDTTGTNNPSMFLFDNAQVDQVSTSPWFAVTTTTSNLVAGTPTRLFVRGDRIINLNSNASPATATTLRATGDLYVGNFTPTLSTTAGNYSFVGNPYQATVDASALTTAGDLNTNFMYVWDAQQGSVGSYVTIDLSDGSNVTGSNANQFIQPGQAFFVRNNLTVTTPPTITFSETSKAVTQQLLATFSTSIATRFELQLLGIDNNVESVLDGISLRFRESYSNNVDDNDAGKLWHPGENIALVNGNSWLSIEQRLKPLNDEIIPFSISGYAASDYKLRVSLMANWPDDLLVYIHDHFLNTVTLFDPQNDYDFSVDPNISDSVSSARFNLLFENTTLGNADVVATDVKLYPNPAGTYFQISGLQNEQDVKVLDLLGKEVLAVKGYFNGNQIEISQLKTGVYIVKLVNGDTNSIGFKLIKE